MACSTSADENPPRPSNIKHQTSDLRPLVLLPINKIGKRALHFLEHPSRFILRPMKSILDTPFDAAEGAAFLVGVVVGFHVFHGRAGKHPFCASDCAAGRAD